jgi:carboxypeptidase family protein
MGNTHRVAFAFIIATLAVALACDEKPSTPSSPSQGAGNLSLSGKVTATPLGEAVPNAQIEAMHGGAATITAMSDASGSYVLRGLLPQQYVIRTTKNGYFVRNQDVTMAGDVRVDIVMARNQVAVTGSVTEAAPCSAGVENARVEILDGPDAGKSASAGSGTYTIAGVSWGTFRLRASKTGYNASEATLDVPPPLAVGGAIARQNFGLQNLVSRYSMSADLRDRTQESGGQVNGALVDITGGPNAGRSTTSVNGAFVLRDLLTGATPLRISHPRYWVFDEPGVVLCGGDAHFEIKMTPNGT